MTSLPKIPLSELAEYQKNLRNNRESNKLLMFFASECIHGLLAKNIYTTTYDAALDAFDYATAMLEEYNKRKLPDA